MGRPLTAADRMPEVGDVLMHCGAGPFCVAKVIQKPGRPTRWFHAPYHEKWNSEEGGFLIANSVYVSRADGGAVTTDD